MSTPWGSGSHPPPIIQPNVVFSVKTKALCLQIKTVFAPSFSLLLGHLSIWDEHIKACKLNCKLISHHKYVDNIFISW